MAADLLMGPAGPADLTAVQRIFAHYVTSSVATFEASPPTVADWRRKLDALAGLGLPFLVASEAGAVVGYAYAAPWRPRPAYRHTAEDTVYVDPGHTGRGIGRALLGALLAASAEAGVRQVIAVIATTGDTSGTTGDTSGTTGDTSGAASVALHRAAGFTDAGRLTAVGRKFGGWVDTVLMQRDLSLSCTSGSRESSAARRSPATS